MSNNMKLYAHQQYLVDLAPKQWGLWHSTGSGKTITAISLAKKNGGSTLIICPKSLKEQWEEQITDNNDWLVITKEQFKRDYKSLGKYDNLIFDEAHYVSNFKSQIAKATIAYCNHYKPNTYLLSATPYLSSPWNVYTYLLIFGKNITWYKWSNSFFTKIKMGNRTIPVVKSKFNGKPMSTVMGEFLKSIGNFVTLEELFDVPEQIDLKETFEITAEQNKAFEEHYDLTPIVNYTKRLQIENGTLKDIDTPQGYITFKSEKLNRILELISEHKKLVVVCRHRSEQHLIEQSLKGKKKVFQIHGDIKNRHEIVKQANEADECVVIVNASCSEGYELPLIPVMVFYSLSNSHKDHIQMRGRILRANHLKKNVYIYLVVKGGVDERVYKSIYHDKKDFCFDMSN